MADLTEVTVDKLPPCDFCREQHPDWPVLARYDGATIHRVWAYMCQAHFERYGVGLGLGRGQRLKVRDSA